MSPVRDASRDVHTVPVGDLVDHTTTGTRCWCAPVVEMICPECGGEDTGVDICWRCQGEGAVPCLDPAAYAGAAGLHIVHSAADGRW